MGEEEAFGVLVRLMYDFGMRSIALIITNIIIIIINQSNPFYSPFSFTKGWAF